MPSSKAESAFRGLSHLTPEGEARMVDVTAKAETAREARARVTLRMKPATLAAIKAGQVAKGDVLGVARTAGILAAKKTSELIPLCHPLRLTGIDVDFTRDARRATVTIETRVRTVDKTGVEMEALVAAAVAGLTVYDMVKAVDKGMVLTDLCLLEKSGGKSGHWVRATGVPRAGGGRRGPSPGYSRSGMTPSPPPSPSAREREQLLIPSPPKGERGGVRGRSRRGTRLRE